MQSAQQYREFADTLAAAAQSANPATREVLMAAADTWRTLADALESPAPAEIVDFAEAGRRLRRTA
jgi:hypothetical protein